MIQRFDVRNQDGALDTTLRLGLIGSKLVYSQFSWIHSTIPRAVLPELSICDKIALLGDQWHAFSVFVYYFFKIGLLRGRKGKSIVFMMTLIT